MRRHLDMILMIVTLAGAYAVKRHYSDAPVDELAYILRPTTALVELVTGLPFTWQAGEGFMNRETFFVIAKPCAGVNFWIASACAAVFAFAGTRRTVAGKLLLTAGAIGAAFAAAVATNAIRIALAIELHTGVGAIGPLDRDHAHHLLGVVVYTVSLCVCFLVARRALVRPAEAP